MITRKQSNLTAEYLFNPIKIQQVNQKDHMDGLLSGISLMEDFQGDSKNIRQVLEHLHNKGIDCEEILNHFDQGNSYSNYFFNSYYQNGNINE